MLTRILATSLYSLVAVSFLAVGGSVLLLGTGLLPQPIREIIENTAHGDLNTLHILQEYGSLLVFIGLITLWFIRHYDESRPFHWAMTTFWGLIALVHWFDVRGSFQAGIGQVINTIPLGLFVVIGLLRQRSEVRAKSLGRATPS